MIMAIFALLVGRSQSFASLHFVLRGNTSHASNSPKPSFSSESTLNSYAWYLQAIPSKFSCATFKNLQNTSHFVTLFSAHGDVVVRFAIFHIVLFQKEEKKGKKKKEKRHSSMVCESWWAPDGIG
jgi:hypothetical protein